MPIARWSAAEARQRERDLDAAEWYALGYDLEAVAPTDLATPTGAPWSSTRTMPTPTLTWGVFSTSWAKLVADVKKKGRSLPLLDSMIAATALAHGFAVATRNVADFVESGVDVVDPFA